MSLTFRPFREDEATALGDLRLEALKNLPMAFAEHAASPREDFTDAIADRAMWGAFDGERPVAMAGITQRGGANIAHRATIVAVYVSPAARGVGAGRALLRTIIEQGRQDGVEVFDLAVGDFNTSALALYTSLGFERCGFVRKAVKVGSDYTNEIQMVLYL